MTIKYIHRSRKYIQLFRVYYRLEGDPDFLDVGSDEFRRKFMQHEMPVVATMASAMMDIRTLEMALAESKIELEGVREEEKAHLAEEEQKRQYNRMSQGKTLVRKLCMYCGKQHYQYYF